MNPSQNPPKKLFDKRFTILVTLQVALGMMLIILIYLHQSSTSNIDQWTYLKEVGSKLQASGLPQEAAIALEDYFYRSSSSSTSSSGLDNISKAKLSYSIGEIYEQTGNFEKALRWYYQVAIFDPHSPQVAEAKEKTVALLEKMKKYAAAKMILDESTELQDKDQRKESPKTGGTLVGKIGNRALYLHEINEAMDELPPVLKESFKGAEGKKNFAKKYVADQLLLEKAKRLNYDENPEIRQQLQKVHEQLMLQKVLKEEILDKVKLDEQDIKNFYEAHRKEYNLSESAEVSFIKVKEKEKAQDLLKKLKDGKKFEELARAHSEDESTKNQGGKVPEKVFADRPFLDFSQEINQRILATKEGKWTDPLLFQGHYYLFIIRNKDKPKELTYEQIKSQVEMDYRRHKEGFHYQKLIEENLKNQDVQLYMDKIQ